MKNEINARSMILISFLLRFLLMSFVPKNIAKNIRPKTSSDVCVRKIAEEASDIIMKDFLKSK